MSPLDGNPEIPVSGVVPAALPPHPQEGADFPKWIEPHPSHVVRANENVSVADYPCHVDRDGKVTVLVANEDEAEAATAEKSPPPESAKSLEPVGTSGLPGDTLEDPMALRSDPAGAKSPDDTGRKRTRGEGMPTQRFKPDVDPKLP